MISSRPDEALDTAYTEALCAALGVKDQDAIRSAVDDSYAKYERQIKQGELPSRSDFNNELKKLNHFLVTQEDGKPLQLIDEKEELTPSISAWFGENIDFFSEELPWILIYFPKLFAGFIQYAYHLYEKNDDAFLARLEDREENTEEQDEFIARLEGAKRKNGFVEWFEDAIIRPLYNHQRFPVSRFPGAENSEQRHRLMLNYFERALQSLPDDIQEAATNIVQELEVERARRLVSKVQPLTAQSSPSTKSSAFSIQSLLLADEKQSLPSYMDWVECQHAVSLPNGNMFVVTRDKEEKTIFKLIVPATGNILWSASDESPVDDLILMRAQQVVFVRKNIVYLFDIQNRKIIKLFKSIGDNIRDLLRVSDLKFIYGCDNVFSVSSLNLFDINSESTQQVWSAPGVHFPVALLPTNDLLMRSGTVCRTVQVENGGVSDWDSNGVLVLAVAFKDTVIAVAQQGHLALYKKQKFDYELKRTSSLQNSKVHCMSVLDDECKVVAMMMTNNEKNHVIALYDANNLDPLWQFSIKCIISSVCVLKHFSKKMWNRDRECLPMDILTDGILDYLDYQSRYTLAMTSTALRSFFQPRVPNVNLRRLHVARSRGREKKAELFISHIKNDPSLDQKEAKSFLGDMFNDRFVRLIYALSHKNSKDVVSMLDAAGKSSQLQDLLCTCKVFLDVSNCYIEATPYRMALGSKNVDMMSLIESYLLKLPNGAKLIASQTREQFPKQEMKPQTNFDELFGPLVSAIKQEEFVGKKRSRHYFFSGRNCRVNKDMINTWLEDENTGAYVWDLDGKLHYIDKNTQTCDRVFFQEEAWMRTAERFKHGSLLTKEQLWEIQRITSHLLLNETTEQVLAEFRKKRAPEQVIKTGFYFDDALLLRAYELFKIHYVSFGCTEGLQNHLFWRQIIGYFHRDLPPNYLLDIFKIKLLHISDGNRGQCYYFSLMPNAGVGYHYALLLGEQETEPSGHAKHIISSTALVANGEKDLELGFKVFSERVSKLVQEKITEAHSEAEELPVPAPRRNPFWKR